MSYTIEVNTLRNSKPEIVIRIEGPFQCITTPSDMTHPEAIQALLGFATEAGEEPAFRFSDGTPATHVARAEVGGLFSERGAMVVIMPTKKVEESK